MVFDIKTWGDAIQALIEAIRNTGSANAGVLENAIIEVSKAVESPPHVLIWLPGFLTFIGALIFALIAILSLKRAMEANKIAHEANEISRKAINYEEYRRLKELVIERIEDVMSNVVMHSKKFFKDNYFGYDQFIEVITYWYTKTLLTSHFPFTYIYYNKFSDVLIELAKGNQVTDIPLSSTIPAGVNKFLYLVKQFYDRIKIDFEFIAYTTVEEFRKRIDIDRNQYGEYILKLQNGSQITWEYLDNTLNSISILDEH